MTNEVSVQLMCIVMRNGVHIWAENDRVKKLMAVLSSPNAPQFIEYDGRFINKSDLTGVYSAEDMEDMTRRKNGGWMCKWGFWHSKNTECNNHWDIANLTPRDHRCKICKNGFLVVDNGDAKKCSCWF